ncbi:hypothetical protein O3P69_014152 [Scylla paramamosain]|uniref:Uncharacterized protein n=1 Tax=Scylla paramamosain TaxID=85552 RepID=A0AAW0SG44_SCYPA
MKEEQVKPWQQTHRQTDWIRKKYYLVRSGRFGSLTTNRRPVHLKDTVGVGHKIQEGVILNESFRQKIRVDFQL